MKLGKVLAGKKDGQRLYTIESGATIRAAAKKIVSLKTGYLMVRAKDVEPAEFIGIITKYDIIKSLCFDNSDPDKDKVDDFMTRKMIVANVMVRHSLSYLPVIEGKQIVGVLSRSDILAELNIERDIELQWLSDYSGASPKVSVY